ncbi:oocyte zinc finger protein XlCOF10-like [Melanaphis sacchari]|uniref:oocyte zinc finger protein XlCOF10-like n=1 Tax=Melanaphis sacchari TaxID=742174 RepID=UPI000DC13617|nr:oocyte zinc finger protein XlCOF10-like [Melanaphis sacchari]
MFKCSICDKPFTLIKNVRRHVKSHDVPDKISCSICSEIFTRRDNLIRHSKDKHRTNIVFQQQPTLTKREIQDFFKPAENIYDYNGKYMDGVCEKGHKSKFTSFQETGKTFY